MASRRKLTVEGARRKVAKMIQVVDLGWDIENDRAKNAVSVWCEDGWYDSVTTWQTYREAEREAFNIARAMIAHLTGIEA